MEDVHARPDTRCIAIHIVRDAAGHLMQDPRIAWFRVHAENHKSIHHHNAYAQLAWDRAGSERSPA
jgi:GTP cyclohydrolase I